MECMLYQTEYWEAQLEVDSSPGDGSSPSHVTTDSDCDTTEDSQAHTDLQATLKSLLDAYLQEQIKVIQEIAHRQTGINFQYSCVWLSLIMACVAKLYCKLWRV